MLYFFPSSGNMTEKNKCPLATSMKSFRLSKSPTWLSETKKNFPLFNGDKTKTS